MPSADLTLEQIAVVHLHGDANVRKLLKELACFVDGVGFGSGTFQEVRVDIFQPTPRSRSHQAVAHPEHIAGQRPFVIDHNFGGFTGPQHPVGLSNCLPGIWRVMHYPPRIDDVEFAEPKTIETPLVRPDNGPQTSR